MLPKFVLKKEEEKRMSGNMNKKFGMLLELETLGKQDAKLEIIQK